MMIIHSVTKLFIAMLGHLLYLVRPASSCQVKQLSVKSVPIIDLHMMESAFFKAWATKIIQPVDLHFRRRSEKSTSN